MNKNPDFLLPKKVEEKKDKKSKAKSKADEVEVKSSVNSEMTKMNSFRHLSDSQKLNISTNSVSRDEYFKKKLKNDIDTVNKQIEKLGDKINRNNDILLEEKSKLEELKEKKRELELLK